MLELSDILEQEYFKFSVNPVTQTNNLKSAIEKYTGVKVNIFKNCKVSEILRQLSKKFSKKKLSKSKFLNSEKVWLCRTQIEVIHILDVNVCLWRRCQGFLVTLLLHLLTMFLSSTCSNRRLSIPPRQSTPPSPAPPAPGSHDCTVCLEQKVHSYSPKCDTIWFPPRVPSPPFSKSPRPLPSLSAPKQSPITALLPPKLPSRATKHALPQSPTPLSSLLLPPPDSEGQRVPNIWYEENLGDMPQKNHPTFIKT